MLFLSMALEVLPELETPLAWYTVVPLAGLEVVDPANKLYKNT